MIKETHETVLTVLQLMTFLISQGKKKKYYFNTPQSLSFINRKEKVLVLFSCLSCWLTFSYVVK